MKQVFIIQSAMPVMTNAPVVARLYGADSDYAAVMVTESTLATMVVIPILMVLMAWSLEKFREKKLKFSLKNFGLILYES